MEIAENCVSVTRRKDHIIRHRSRVHNLFIFRQTNDQDVVDSKSFGITSQYFRHREQSFIIFNFFFQQ